MSNQRYPPKFKYEAVRPVLERGYTVAGSRLQEVLILLPERNTRRPSPKPSVASPK